MNELTGLNRNVWRCLALFSFFLPISIALVQPVAYTGAVLAMIAWWKCPRAQRPPYIFFRFILVFLAVVVVASLFGVRPEASLKKLNRFVVLPLAWAVVWVVWNLEPSRRSAALARLAACFLLGLGLKGAYDMVRVPIMVSMEVPLFMTGNMRDPQFYMVGVCLSAGLVTGGGWTLRYPPTAAALFFSAAGLILHFKRGAWAATLGALAVMAVASRKWRPLGVALLALLALSAFPPVRERLGQLGREFDIQRGGRLLLWTEVGPALIAEHPMGMGWKAVRHEDFKEVNDRVEPRLNHLHNNFLEVTLELGWAGLAAWSAWMLAVLAVAWRAHCRARLADPLASGVGLGVLGAFSALMLNGLVEYNFGDSEIFMLLLLVMGLAAAVHLLGRPGEADPST